MKNMGGVERRYLIKEKPSWTKIKLLLGINLSFKN